MIKTFIDYDEDDDDKENEKEISQYEHLNIGMDDVINLVLNNKYETSVSLNHYMTAYLNLK